MSEPLHPDHCRTLWNACTDAMFVFEPGWGLVHCNAAARRLLERIPGPLGPEHPLAAAADEDGLLRITDGAGEPRRFEVRDIDLPREGDTPLFARMLHEVTDLLRLQAENRRLQDELDAQALKDRTTGLLNPRGLLVALEPQVSRSRRYGNPLSMAVLQVTGEHIGERQLVSLAQLLKDQLRWADLVGYGGDGEYILALPETRLDDALKLAGKLTDLMAARFGDELLPTFGVVEWGRTDSAQSLLKRARAALGRARAAEAPGAVAAG